jgi:hypothetical protein
MVCFGVIKSVQIVKAHRRLFSNPSLTRHHFQPHTTRSFTIVGEAFLREVKSPRLDTLQLANLIVNMRHLRIKLFPVADLEGCFHVLQKSADLFIATKKVELKHAWSQLFVELLLPVAEVRLLPTLETRLASSAMSNLMNIPLSVSLHLHITRLPKARSTCRRFATLFDSCTLMPTTYSSEASTQR